MRFPSCTPLIRMSIVFLRGMYAASIRFCKHHYSFLVWLLSYSLSSCFCSNWNTDHDMKFMKRKETLGRTSRTQKSPTLLIQSAILRNDMSGVIIHELIWHNGRALRRCAGFPKDSLSKTKSVYYIVRKHEVITSQWQNENRSPGRLKMWTLSKRERESLLKQWAVIVRMHKSWHASREDAAIPCRVNMRWLD